MCSHRLLEKRSNGYQSESWRWAGKLPFSRQETLTTIIRAVEGVLIIAAFAIPTETIVTVDRASIVILIEVTGAITAGVTNRRAS